MAGAGMSCCRRSCFSPSSSPKHDSCSLWQLFQVWRPIRKFLSMSLLLGVYSRVKDSVHELKIYFLKHLWYLPPSVFQRVLRAPRVLHLLVGENGAGAVGMWGDGGVSCSLQCRIALRGWAEAGQGCAGVVQRVGWASLPVPQRKFLSSLMWLS